jgi:hypothetical protein
VQTGEEVKCVFCREPSVEVGKSKRPSEVAGRNHQRKLKSPCSSVICGMEEDGGKEIAVGL